VDEENGNPRIAAACGATGYLDDIRLAANGESGRERRTFRHHRQGETHYVNRDFPSDPCDCFDLDTGKHHGILTSACVALKQEGRVIGAFTLYAGEQDFFDQQQVDLLVQIGADVSFAIDNMTHEASRKRAEQALQEETVERLRTVEALRDKEQMLLQQSHLAAMGEMINNIAHQWRQPLNILGLLVQQMRMCYDNGSFSKEYLDTSVNKSMGLINHMSQTIDDFRNFFKPDKEKVEFTVHELVARTISMVEDSFRNHHIGIEINLRANPSIVGFPNEYSQVLLNILMNARDVLLERSPDDAKVTVTINKQGKRAVVTVADNAGGIAEGIIDKIFEPYFTTKGPNRGTGVGLFMSKMIIENNMEGKLTVRNSAVGAEFRIEV
jgi:C4-dicarboxylate-specific signal transduction histidine kinase